MTESSDIASVFMAIGFLILGIAIVLLIVLVERDRRTRRTARRRELMSYELPGNRAFDEALHHRGRHPVEFGQRIQQ